MTTDGYGKTRTGSTDRFTIHERSLSTLLLELTHRKIEVERLERNDAIEKIVTVVLVDFITQRRALEISKTIRIADTKAENFLNLTSPTYKGRA
jgi:hypothetical protein